MSETIDKREVVSQSSELLWSQKELKQLKDGILDTSKSIEQNKQPSQTEILKKLHTAMQKPWLFDKEKVLAGGSKYNKISNFEKKQGVPIITMNWINGDGTYKYQLKTRWETTNFDYDLETQSYYTMPAGKPEYKVMFTDPMQMIKLVTRLNFAKYEVQQIKNYKHPSAVDAVVATTYKFEFVWDEVSIRRKWRNKAWTQMDDWIDHLFNAKEIFEFERDEKRALYLTKGEQSAEDFYNITLNNIVFYLNSQKR